MKFADRILRKMGLQRSEHRAPPRRASSVWGAASTERQLRDWFPWTFSPDYETRNALRFIRARARQLARDNPYAAGFVASAIDNVVGPKGRILQAKITNANGDLVTRTNDEIERAWADWCMPEFASADGREGWRDLCAMRLRTRIIDGESLTRKLSGFDNKYGFALQFIDPDLLDEMYNVPGGPDQNEIRMGVEIDRWNRPVAYHVWNQYDFERLGTPRVRERIPASEIIHDFRRYRPNQTRGISELAPVMVPLHKLERCENAVLDAMHVFASQMGYIVNKSDMAVAAFDWNATDEETGEKLHTQGGKSFDVESGIMAELLPGQEVQFPTPTQPSTTHEMFNSVVLRAVARGENVSTMTMTGNAKEFTFSSMRGALLIERDRWRAEQQYEITHFDRLIFREWIQMALLYGAIKLDSRLASNYTAVEFKGRGWPHVQPREEIEAIERRIKLGLTSRQDVIAEEGGDYEETIDKLAHEEEYADQKDVDISGGEVAAVSAPGTPPPGDGTNPDDPNAPPVPNQSGARHLALAGGDP